jgi:hypothetical protein
VIKQSIFCDCCGKEIISGRGWENEPVSVALVFSAPAQKYDSRKLEHTCWHCWNAIQRTFDEFVAAEKGQT